MTATLTIFEGPAELGQALAGEIRAGIASARAEGRRYVLGCPSGRSLRETYQALGRSARQAPYPTDHVVVAMMDEFLLPGADGLALCPGDAHYSCRRFGREEILAELGGGELWIPDPRAPERFDARLVEAGGIDLFLLASGASDGHVAFNPPGTTLESGTRVLRLAESTRRDNLATFPAFRDLAEVPAAGVSVGLGTIAGLSRAAVMVLHGSSKREAARRLLAPEAFEPSWPATVIHACRGARILLDRAAAGGAGTGGRRRSPDGSATTSDEPPGIPRGLAEAAEPRPRGRRPLAGDPADGGALGNALAHGGARGHLRGPVARDRR